MNDHLLPEASGTWTIKIRVSWRWNLKLPTPTLQAIWRAAFAGARISKCQPTYGRGLVRKARGVLWISRHWAWCGSGNISSNWKSPCSTWVSSILSSLSLSKKQAVWIWNLGFLIPKHSPCYEGLHNNVSTTLVEMKNRPWPAGTPDFIHHRHIKAYLDAAAQESSTRSSYLYNTKVERVWKTGAQWHIQSTLLIRFEGPTAKISRCVRVWDIKPDCL